MENHPEFGSALNDLLFEKLYTENNTLDEIKALIDRGADINARNEEGETVFQAAAGNFNDTLDFEIIGYLVREAGVDLTAYDNDFCFVLHDVALLGDIPRLEFFMKLGATPNQVDPTSGMTLIEDLEAFLEDPEGRIETANGETPDYIELERSIDYLKKNGAKRLAELFVAQAQEFIAVSVLYPNLFISKFGQIKLEHLQTSPALLTLADRLKQLATQYFAIQDQQEQSTFYAQQVEPVENQLKKLLEVAYDKTGISIL